MRDRGWDHHQNIKQGLTYGFPPRLPALDQALATLILDLEARGLGERVLLLLASEFGRTPRLNPRGGRDHWPRASSCLLYGAGLRRGVVLGKTHARGEEPIARPLSPADLHATILGALQVKLDRSLRTPSGRPIRVLERGAEPAREVLAS
ncbi:MAG: DUF1501 domain-containing protein [Planctomycetota bacterium]